jgi:hypothetical protein
METYNIYTSEYMYNYIYIPRREKNSKIADNWDEPIMLLMHNFIAHICKHMCIYVHIYVYTHMCIYFYKTIHIYIHRRTCISIYIYLEERKILK